MKLYRKILKETEQCSLSLSADGSSVESYGEGAQVHRVDKCPMTPIDYYLSWVNDFLSVEKFAAYYGFETLIEAQDMIARGRLMHEATVAELKARGET